MAKVTGPMGQLGDYLVVENIDLTVTKTDIVAHAERTSGINCPNCTTSMVWLHTSRLARNARENHSNCTQVWCIPCGHAYWVTRLVLKTLASMHEEAHTGIPSEAIDISEAPESEGETTNIDSNVEETKEP